MFSRYPNLLLRVVLHPSVAAHVLIAVAATVRAPIATSTPSVLLLSLTGYLGFLH